MDDEFIVKKRIKLIQQSFGTSLVDRDGINISVSCVNEKCSTFGKPAKKKLVIRVDNEFYHCWVCGLKGKGLSRFFARYKPRFGAAAKELFKHHIQEAEEEVVPPVYLPEGFTLLAALPKRADPDLKACRKYLLDRGLTLSDLWYFKVGSDTKGKYRRRVIIHSFDADGKLNYFTARTIDGDTTRKYVNARVKRTEIIFNEINIDWSEPLTIVEGPFDLIKANQNCTCLLGSSLADRHALFQQIVKNKTDVILCLDPDANVKLHKIAANLSKFGVNVKMIEIDGFDDVGEMPPGHFETLLNTAVQWNEMHRLRSLISGIKSGSLI